MMAEPKSRQAARMPSMMSCLIASSVVMLGLLFNQSSDAGPSGNGIQCVGIDGI
jgi:hypothetical protein